MLTPAQQPTLADFDYNPRTRVLFGNGSVSRIGELAVALPARRVLLVTDKGIVAAGHAGRVQELLEAAGVAVTLFSDVLENPTDACVQNCARVAREAGVEGFVALGGGSSMDTAKGCNFILSNGGQMKDYLGWGKAKKPMLPLIAIPTTAGTGSECQSYALISDDQTHTKMACGDPKAAARVALLDPELTLSQPASVTACTGIDALTHALESAVTLRRTEISSVFSREAFRLLATGFNNVLSNANSLSARGQTLLGAAWAGTAIENSMLGAAHAAANPLTARYGIVHGQAVGLMMPHVLRLNSADSRAEGIYEKFCDAAGLGRDGISAGHALATMMEAFLHKARLETRLSTLHVDGKSIDEMAEEAAQQWTGKFNPLRAGAHEYKLLYEAAF